MRCITEICDVAGGNLAGSFVEWLLPVLTLHPCKILLPEPASMCDEPRHGRPARE